MQEKITFGYDLEKIIDDWILMGFLVGNDFIPNLPNLHINHVMLNLLYIIKVHHKKNHVNLTLFDTSETIIPMNRNMISDCF